MSEERASDLPPRIPCLCSLKGDGETSVYEGPLLVGAGGSYKTLTGSLVLGRGAKTGLYARFQGSFSEYGDLVVSDGKDFTEVQLPNDPVLREPYEGQRDEDGNKPPVTVTIPVSSTQGGNLDEVDYFLFGCSSYLEPILPATQVAEGMQRQQSFSLPGWDLVLALARTNGEHELVVRARPDGSFRIDEDRLDDLSLNLFYLLSFLASREVGVGPIFGLDPNGEIVWARYSSTRSRAGSPGFHWCPNGVAGEALASISQGFTLVLSDPATEKILTRSLEALTFANSSEVLDVRIPIVCTGLETLAWAYLRRFENVGRKAMKAMKLGEMLRRLLVAGQIPLEIPEHFAALKARADSVRELKGADGPEVLSHVRNGLVHPPKSLNDPEWPTGDQLVEAWQLATWYLELVVLRCLQYDGTYLRRIDLWNGSVSPTQVPWANSVGTPGKGYGSSEGAETPGQRPS